MYIVLKTLIFSSTFLKKHVLPKRDTVYYNTKRRGMTSYIYRGIIYVNFQKAYAQIV